MPIFVLFASIAVLFDGVFSARVPLKEQQRKITDKKKTVSGLAFTEDPKWFKIVNSVLSDTNKALDS